MSRGDSESPKFDDLDFSNLEPLDGDSMKSKSPEAVGHDPEGTADAPAEESDGLDFASASAEPGESLSGMFAATSEEPPETAAEPHEVTADEASSPAEASPEHSGIDFGDMQSLGDGASGMSFGESDADEESPDGDAVFGDDAPAGEGLGVVAAEGSEPTSEEESGEEPEAKQGKVAAVLAWLAASNRFTVLMGIALGALFIACLLLVLELWSYDFTLKKDSVKQRIIEGPTAVIVNGEQPMDIRSIRV